MIRKDKHKYADGTFKTQIRVTEGYRDSKTGKSKQKTIKSFGYLEDQPDQEKFLEQVRLFDEEYKKNKKIVLNEVKTKPFYDDEASTITNFGYRFLETIYDSLELKELFDTIEYKGTHSLNDMFKFLVIQRIMNPDSKRATYQMINNFYLKHYNFSLHELYRSLDVYANNSDKLQMHLNNMIKKTIGRDSTACFYDSTNYYFQKDYEDVDNYEEVIPMITDKIEIKRQKLINVIDENGVEHQLRKISGLLKRGVSKEHVVDPIVQLGLMMDSNGIPISAKAFPGNTSDSKTLIPILNSVKNNYGLDRTVIVADKGMNSNDNINIICNNGDGYMFSQILKGKKGYRYKDRLFDDTLYTIVNEDYKYQMFEEDYDGIDSNGKKIKRKRKVLIYWNGAAARREKKQRDEKIKKAEKALSNKAYLCSHGYDKFINKINSVSTTGEVADSILLSVDYEKASEESKFDGYFAIVTSELHYDEKKIREIYHGLWRIEESFRITKSDLAARPMYVRTENHIKGHILICFVALTILRILQYKMNYSLSVERIVRALNMCSCSEFSKGLIHIIKKDTFEKFNVKIDKNGIEYYKLSLSSVINETVEDFKSIITYYEVDALNSIMNKAAFDKSIKSIKLK